MQFEDIIKNRYSVRSYKEDMVEKEKLDRILEAGRIAPTACNLCPQRIYVLTKKEDFEKLGSASRMRYNAPVVLLVCADTSVSWKNPIEEGYSSYEMDASIVCTHMMLEATNLGLGTVWIRYFNSKELQEAFNLDSNIKPVCFLTLGYASDDSKPNDRHKQRIDIEDMVTYL